MSINPLHLLLIFVLPLLFIIGLVFYWLRKATRDSILKWVRVVARVTALITSVFTLVRVAVLAIPGSDLRYQVQMDFNGIWPVIPDSLDYKASSTAKVVSGGLDHATLMISGLSIQTRVFLALSVLATGVVVVAICLVIAKVAAAIRSGVEFRDIPAKWLKRASWLVLICGEAAAIFGQWSGGFAALDLQSRDYSYQLPTNIPNPWLGTSQTADPGTLFGWIPMTANFQLPIEPWPILVAVALYLVAQILRSGRTLEVETEGLV